MDFFQLPGRVLHIDGDPLYLRKCLQLYERIGVPVYGVHCHETDMPDRIIPLLEQVRPDILVVTGHDAYSKSKGSMDDLKAYRHSKYFVQTVRQARKKFRISINSSFSLALVNLISNRLFGQVRTLLARLHASIFMHLILYISSRALVSLLLWIVSMYGMY